MAVLKTAEDKVATLESRRKERLEVKKDVEHLIAPTPDEGGNITCWYVFRKMLRLMPRRRAPTAPVPSNVDMRVFGPSKASSAVLSISAASDKLSDRIDALERRAKSHRDAARSGMLDSDRRNAIRELKKAKACEKQAEASRDVLDALQAQNDMLEQTSIQRQIAKALGESAKTMKSNKLILSKAENAVETACEVKDMHEDLSNVMSGLGESIYHEDEDDLMKELDAMIMPKNGDEMNALEEMRQLELKHNNVEISDRRRICAQNTKREKQMLLAESGASAH